MDNISVLFTESCNMKCKYCFEGKSEEERDISKETVRNVINFIKKSSDTGWYNINVFGGEPFVREDLIEELLVYGRENLDGKFNVSVFTNGTIYNENIKDILKKYRDDVQIVFQISLDGGKEVHNLNRVMKDGSGSFDKVIENINKYSKIVDILRVNSVLNPDNIEYFYDSFVYIKENVLYDYISFEFSHDNNVGFEIDNVKEYEEEMEKVYNKIKEWVYEEGKDVLRKVAPFSRALFKSNSNEVCGSGKNSLVVDVNGDIYPCYIALENNKYLLGNVNEGVFDLENDILNTDIRPYSCYNDEYCELDCDLSGNCYMCIKKGLDDRNKIERESKKILCDLYHINYKYIEKLREYIKREEI